MSRRKSTDDSNRINSVPSVLWNRRSKRSSLDSLRNRPGSTMRKSIRSFARRKTNSVQIKLEDSIIPDFPKVIKPGPLEVLPDEFLDWAESPVMIPQVATTLSNEIYGFFAKTFGINDYEFNSLSFSFIDRVKQMLYIAQENMKMSDRCQKYFIAWYAYIIGLIKANNWTTDEAYDEVCKNFHISISEKDMLELGMPIPFPLSEGRELNKKLHLNLFHPEESEKENISILLHKIFGNKYRMLLTRNTVCGDYEVNCTNLTVQFPKPHKPSDPLGKLKAPAVTKKEKKEEKPEAKRGKKSEDVEEFLTLHNYDETSDMHVKKDRASQSNASKRASYVLSEDSCRDEEIPELTMEQKLLMDAEMRVKYKYILPLIEATDEEYFKTLFVVKSQDGKKKGKDKKK